MRSTTNTISRTAGLRHAHRLSDINKVLENIVYMHLRVSGYTVTVGQMGAREIDFVCEKKGERLYVQVAYLIPDKKTWGQRIWKSAPHIGQLPQIRCLNGQDDRRRWKRYKAYAYN